MKAKIRSQSFKRSTTQESKAATCSCSLLKDSPMRSQMCAAASSVGIVQLSPLNEEGAEFSDWNLRKTSWSVHSDRPLVDSERRQGIGKPSWTELQPLSVANLGDAGRLYSSWLTDSANDANRRHPSPENCDWNMIHQVRIEQTMIPWCILKTELFQKNPVAR